MGRNKQFEPTQVLDKAMQQFWQHGYAATSIEDLVNATGVQRYGLYGTFGGKHALFLQVLDRYQELMVGQMVADLESAESAWPEIVGFFDMILSIAVAPPASLGCLMCNSATELALHDPDVNDRMTIYEQRLQTLFAHAVERAQARSQLGQALDSQATGTYLLGITVGLFLLVKTNLPAKALRDYVTVALEGTQALSRQ